MEANCDSIDWSFIRAAEAQSALSGVVGGFLFAGIILLLTTKRSDGRRVPALMLFCSAFFALEVCSYISSVVAGEGICFRAYAEGMVGSGLFCVGALGIFCGIAVLLEVYEGKAEDLLRISRLIAYSVAVIALFMEGLAAVGFMVIVYQNAVPPWFWVVFASYAVGTPATVVFLRVRRPVSDGDRARVLRQASYLSILCALVGAVIFGIAAGTPPELWRDGDTVLISNTAVITSLVFPAAGVIGLLRTLPRPHREKYRTGAGARP
ncbi:hypothetical protein [Allonocardiopsis opalescens]|uniref:Uncharacterized protein n=1 Tax=Allonocardiopsis opalescens TaxID=1144618 RepID=A0A2T0PPC3_9ACTN|nr:hypothetical protein [Allonocardiopsis opalescens]PRX90755.1 hypothetical protein CLV72_11714 [Allonocardiopsis opalescens]